MNSCIHATLDITHYSFVNLKSVNMFKILCLFLVFYMALAVPIDKEESIEEDEILKQSEMAYVQIRLGDLKRSLNGEIRSVRYIQKAMSWPNATTAYTVLPGYTVSVFALEACVIWNLSFPFFRVDQEPSMPY